MRRDVFLIFPWGKLPCTKQINPAIIHCNSSAHQHILSILYTSDQCFGQVKCVFSPSIPWAIQKRHIPGGKPSWLISRANLSATDQHIDLRCSTPVFQGPMSHEKQVFEECHSDIETFYEAAPYFMTGNKEKGNSTESFFSAKTGGRGR